MKTQTVTLKEQANIGEVTWIGWAPLVLATLMVASLRPLLPPWAFMWILAVAIFAGFKWWTWWRAVPDGSLHTLNWTLAYFFLWPGMDARHFLALLHAKAKIPLQAWAWAFTKMAFGAVLVWGIAREAGHGLLAGWIGMVGLIFLLHFGAFAVLALFWQGRGVPIQPLMKCPAAADSLSDFWGRRWNAGFRDIVFGLFFTRLAKRLGTAWATIAIFLFSGLVHDLVITFPARGGYGLPTLYFLLQGVAMLFERSTVGVRFGVAGGWKGRIFTIAVVAIPAFWLFPPPFVLRVMVPFLQIIQALP